MKRFLVPLDPTDYTTAATTWACALASIFEGEVEGLAVVDTEGIEEDVALPFRADLQAFPHPKAVELVENAKAGLAKAVDSFETLCGQSEIRFSTRETSGSPAASIVSEARFHDLVLMGLKSHFNFVTDNESGDTLRKVIHHSPVPLLLLPAYGNEAFRRITIAFDGSPPATRALHQFVPLAKAWQPEIRIVAAKMEGREGQFVLEAAKGYLEAHGVTNVQIAAEEKSIIHAFQEDYVEWSDLVVLGASSKNIVEKIFIGSFPRMLIEELHHAVFIHP